MRDYSVTITKGIAIILMVMGHARCPEFINNYLGMMRMPIFFMMSGYCFKDKYLFDAKSYSLKRVTGIYLPYIKWSLFFLLFHNIFFRCNIINGIYGFRGNVSALYSGRDFLIHAERIIMTMSGEESMVGGFWFLKSLFVGSFIFYFTRKYIKNSIFAYFVLLALTTILSYLQIQIPHFGIGSRDFFAASFIMFGHLYKQKGWKWEYNIGGNVFSLVLIGIGTLLWKTSMLSYEYWQVIPYAFTSILGCSVIFHISHLLARNIENTSQPPLLSYALEQEPLTVNKHQLLGGG
jgi:fucose 4-O-acetylase-like acetyltransferase